MARQYVNGSGFGNYRPPLVFDIETAPILGAREYIEEPAAPANYKDPEKIAAYIEEKHGELVNRAALDPDLARVVCLAAQSSDDAEPICFAAKDEDDERALLNAFWARVGTGPDQATLIGFGILTFDLRVLLRRSLYLNAVRPATIAIDKYRHPGVVDLMDELSFHGAEKYHSLAFYVKRFGLGPFDDDISGASVGACIAVGDWASVTKHCCIDVQKETALAKRIGAIT